MKSVFVIIIVRLALNAELNAQTLLPYQTGFDNSSEQYGWQEYRKGFLSNSNWTYVTFSAYSVPVSLAHFYPVAGSGIVDDWFVSPAFDFTSGGKIDSVFHNFSGFGVPTQDDELSIYLLNGSANPDLANFQVLLKDYKINYVSDNVWYTDTNIIIPPIQGLSYIAFRFKTIINWIDVQFDNLRISGNTSTSVEDLPSYGNELKIYPDPVHNELNISQSKIELKEISIFDITGKSIKSFSAGTGDQLNRIDISELPDGIFILKAKSINSSYNKLFVKR